MSLEKSEVEYLFRAINRKAVLHALDGDLGLLRSLSEIYLEDYPTMVQTIISAANASDAIETREAAHRLRGLVSNFRFAECEKLLGEVEGNVIKNALPSQDQLNQIAKLCDLLAADLQVIVNSSEC